MKKMLLIILFPFSLSSQIQTVGLFQNDTSSYDGYTLFSPNETLSIEKGKWTFVKEDNWCYIGSIPLKEDGDYIIDLDSGKLLIDNISVLYLEGMTIDYKKDIFGQRLMIDNPNVKSMCGCGESFQLA